MVREKLNSKHITFIKSFGLENLDFSDISLFKYKSGEYIFRQGYDISHLLFLISGRMKVFYTAPNGRELLLCSYDSGIIGDIEMMLKDDAAGSSVQAISNVSCIGIPLERYDRQLRGNITFMNKISAGLASKLSQISRNHAVNLLHSLEARLCSYIALTSTNGYFAEKRTVLSEILGTSYRHLLRTLEKLCLDGVLKKEGRGYKIVNKRLLEDIGDDYYII